MDFPSNSQEIELYVAAATGAADVTIGIVFIGGIRQAYCWVTDDAGNSTTITYNMAIDNLEHTLRADFSGNTYTFFVDNVNRGSHTTVSPAIATINYMNLFQDPKVINTNMSVSKIEITTCL